MNQDGESVLHRHLTAAPAPLLKAIAPYQEALVVGVECRFTWDWLADLCAREGIPFGLGQALSMNAIHGGNATHDRIEAQNIAVRLRGGMLPQAYVYPAERRATRDRLRRRIHVMRTRAEFLPHVQPTNRPDNLPESGQKMASQAHRAGVAERFPKPAVPQSIEVDLALMGHDDHLLRDVELSVLTTAKQHDAHTLDLRRPSPGIGEILSLVLRYEIHPIARCPRVQDVVSDCRLVTCAKAAAGTR